MRQAFSLPTPTGHLAGWRAAGSVGPPILALHGWLDNADSFVPLQAQLPAHDWIALDLPGHGLSSHRPPGQFGAFVDYVEDIARAVDGLGLSEFDLLGHSMGGALAVLVAAAFPDRVRRLVLLDALGPLATPSDETPKAMRRGVEARLGFVERRRPYASQQEAIDLRIAANQLSPASAALLVERGTVHAADGWRWSSDPRLTLPSVLRLDEAQVLACIAAIQAPTLAVLATPRTSYLSGALAEQRIQSFANLEMAEIPGHHHLHMDQPAAVATLLARFLS